MNIKQWLIFARKKLCKIHIYSFYDLYNILSYVLKKPYSWLIGFDDYTFTTNELNKLNFLLNRRSNREPVAYLIGEWEFWSLRLKVTKNTFIPRVDTEILVEQSIRRINDPAMKILDLGTGSGAIAIAIATMKPDCLITGIDIFQQSLNVAINNTLKLGITNINYYYGNWFSFIKNNKFNIIVSNPPYVSIKEQSMCEKELTFEPLRAFIAGENGLKHITHIVQEAKKHLYVNGWLLIEHGWKHKIKVQELFERNKFININTYKDYGGNDRVTVGKKKK